MKIGVDLDGIIADINPPLRKAIIKGLGIDLWADGGPKTYWIQKDPRIVSIPGGEEFVENLFINPTTYINAAQVSNVVLSLTVLNDQEHDIWIITARPEVAREATKIWLKNNGLEWAVEKLIICDHNPLTRSTTKLETCKNLGLDLLIDDHASTIKTICEELHIPGILIEYPWNINEDVGKMGIYCENWNEILNKIKLLSPEKGSLPRDILKKP